MTMRRLYARLLRLYPPSFYTRFGDEMLAVFEQAQATRHPGLPAALAFYLRELGGLLASVTYERWLAPRPPLHRLLLNWRLALPAGAESGRGHRAVTALLGVRRPAIVAVQAGRHGR